MKLKKMKEILMSIKTATTEDLEKIGKVIEMIKEDEEKIRRQQFESLKKRLGD